MNRPIRQQHHGSFPKTAEEIGRAAIWALYTELALAPKPGLVSPLDNGSHTDMDMGTFLRSLSALRPYYRMIAGAGADGAGFAELTALGMAAEQQMLTATGGVNTHRGAVFCIGLLAAAAGLRQARGHRSTLGQLVADHWGADIVAAAGRAPASHGSRAIARHGARGARQEAAAGFPTLYTLALPALMDGLKATGSREKAGMQALFTTMAHLEDTNLLHRGGAGGLAFVQNRARQFLATGGVAAADWRDQVLALHRDCIARWLSPGGSADMLAAAWFLWAQGDG